MAQSDELPSRHRISTYDTPLNVYLNCDYEYVIQNWVLYVNFIPNWNLPSEMGMENMYLNLPVAYSDPMSITTWYPCPIHKEPAKTRRTELWQLEGWEIDMPLYDITIIVTSCYSLVQGHAKYDTCHVSTAKIK